MSANLSERQFGHRVLIDRADIHSATLDDGGAAPDIADGHALFRIERVALTANNVTYAAAGDMMGYWRFFPAPEGKGGLPVWGYAVCEMSRVSSLKAGERVYGYWPLAERLLVEVKDVDARGFSDSSDHRQGLSPIYNRYERAPGDAEAETEMVAALFRPLFTTGWLIAKQLEGASDYGAAQILISSASSKTSIAAAWSLAQREGERPDIIGLTSPANVDFCQGLGIYDRVLAYDALADIAADRPTTYVDMSGNGALRHAVHTRFGSRLGYSMAVGMTHWTESQGNKDLPPPEAKLFFAPAVMEQEQNRLGRDGYHQALAADWRAFADFIRPQVDIEIIDGLDDARTAYERLARGDVTGQTALIVEP